MFNTEPERRIKFNIHFRTYFILASGFKDLILLSKANLQNTTVIYYDINPYSIEFKKWILSCWDGKKNSLYKKIMKREYNYALSDYKFTEDFIKLSSKEQFEHSWSVELERWNNNKKSIVFDNIKNCNKLFITIDITSNFKELKKIITTAEEPIYFWFSNCFKFAPIEVEDKTSFEKFFNIMKNSNKRIFLSGKKYDGKYLENFI